MEQSKFEIWVKRCQDLHLSENCIKGLAFIFGLQLHKAEKMDQAQVDRNIDNYLNMDLCRELSNQINPELAQHLFLRTVMLIKAFSSLEKVEFPKDRVNSDGKPTDLFDPYDEQEIFNKDNALLADYHNRYEKFFEQIGEGFSLAEFSYEHSFVYSDKFVIQGMLEDVFGLQFFTSVYMARNVLPPIFATLLDEEWNELNLTEEGYLPFQAALAGYIRGLDMALIEFIWNSQRVLFYDQTTLEATNLDFQWGSIFDFVRLVNYYCENYFAHDNIKAHTAKHLHLFQSQKDIDFDSYIAPEGVNLYEFLLDRIKKIEGYDYRTEESLSDSNRLQYKANFFFKFMFGIAANPDLLVFKQTSENS